MAKRGEKWERRSLVLEPDAAGIDIGAEEIYVAIPPDRDEKSTRRFSSFTGDLYALPLGSASAGFRAWRWSRQECTGSRCFRSWRSEGSRSTWSTTLSEECAGTQERRIRLPVDPVSALGRVAEGELPATRGDLCYSYSVAPPRQPAGDGRRAHSAHAEGA